MLGVADELRLRGICGEDIRPSVARSIRELTEVDVTVDDGGEQIDLHTYLGELLLKGTQDGTEG